MSPSLEKLLSVPPARERLEYTGILATRQKLKNLLFAHTTALEELKGMVEKQPGTVFLGASRCLHAYEIYRLNPDRFAELSEKHYFDSAQKCAIELKAEAEARLPAHERTEIETALKSESLLLHSANAVKTLETIRDAEIGKKAATTPLGGETEKHQRTENYKNNFAMVVGLAAGVGGFAILGIWGGVIGLILGAGLTAAAMSSGGEVSDRQQIVELHEAISREEKLLLGLGLSVADALKNPQSALSAIRQAESEVGGVLARYIPLRAASAV